jgi:hypothetical protein
MTARNHKHLGVEKLENRQLMAADVAFNQGVLEVQGTDAADRIVIDEVTEVGYSPFWFNRATGQSGGGFYEYDAIRVRVMDMNTAVEKAQLTINADYVDRIFLEAGKGDDYIHNLTGVAMEAYGESGNDEIIGGWGADHLDGGTGHDEIFGRDGDDHIWGGSGDDWLWGGNGDNHIYGEAGRDFLAGGDDNDYLHGGTGRDQLHGGPGDDTLDGRDAEFDWLWADEGRDTLIGSGHDELRGSEGADIYYFKPWDFINQQRTWSDVTGHYGWQLTPDQHFTSGQWAGYSVIDEANMNYVLSGF